MFRSKRQLKGDAEVVITLSPETQKQLEALNGDISVLREMLSDISDTAGEILGSIEHEIAVQVNKVIEQAEAAAEPKPSKPDVPEAMLRTPMRRQSLGDDRVRETPFTRAPRPEQVTWLSAVLADGNWHNANGIAREYAVDEPHLRYMKRAVGARLREMHEEGLVERRDSREKGAMFEYRRP